MNKQTVRRIFLFFILYLPLQYILVGVVGVIDSEPWPAFVLPGFKSVYVTQNKVETTEARLYMTGGDRPTEQKKINASELFEGLQTSQLQGFLQSSFGDPSASYSYKTRRWLKRRLKRLHPDIPVNSFKVEWITTTFRQTGNRARLINEEVDRTINIQL